MRHVLALSGLARISVAVGGTLSAVRSFLVAVASFLFAVPGKRSAVESSLTDRRTFLTEVAVARLGLNLARL